jgi:hypothetical protein
MNAKPSVAASRAEQPDDLAANAGGCDRNSLRAALMKLKIRSNGLGIWGISDKIIRDRPQLQRQRLDDFEACYVRWKHFKVTSPVAKQINLASRHI